LPTVVFAGEWGGPLQICDLALRKVQPVPSGIEGAATSVAFAEDGRTLAVTGSDGTVRLWDVLLVKREP
jgi:WD40 repeat protein